MDESGIAVLASVGAWKSSQGMYDHAASLVGAAPALSKILPPVLDSLMSVRSNFNDFVPLRLIS